MRDLLWQVTIAIFKINQVLASHYYCAINLENPYVDATEACFGEPLATSMRNNFNFVLDRSLTSGATETKEFIANGVIAAAVTPRNPQKRTLMARTRNYGKTWWCFGYYEAGCLPDYGKFGTKTMANGDPLTNCCGGEFAWGGGNPVVTQAGYQDSPTKTLSWYARECYCTFSDDSCQFKEYTCSPTGGGNRVSMYLPTNHANGGITAKTDQSYEQNLSCDYRFLMKLGLAFTGKVIVCGQETLTSSGTVVIQYSQVQASGFHQISPSSQEAWFSLTFPNANWNQCIVKTTSFVTTNCGSTSLVSTSITRNPMICANNYCQMEIDKTKPIPKTIFYVKAQTRGLVTSCKKIEVEICGHETINNLLTSDPFWIHLTAGSGSFVQNDFNSNPWFSMTGSTYCVLNAFELLEYSTASNTYVTYTGPPIVTLTSNRYINIYRSPPTSNPYVREFFIRAKTIGQVVKYQKFTICICGAETITPLPSSKSFLYILKTGAANIQLPEDVNSWFVNSNNHCPITSYLLMDSTGTTAYTTGDVSLSTAGIYEWLRIDTTNPFTKNFKVRGQTQSGQNGYMPLRVKVCGAETITQVSSYPSHSIYPFDEGWKSYTMADFQAFTGSDETECPITSYTLMKKTGTSTYINYPGSQIVLGSDGLLTINTIAALTEYVYIRARTDSNIVSYYQVLIRVCGDEILTKTLTSDPKYFYKYRQGTNWKNIAANDITAWFTGPNDCQIKGYDLYQSFDGVQFFKNSVQNIKIINNKEIEVFTDRNQKETFYAGAESMGKVKIYQAFEVWICGAERILEINEDLFYTYEKNSGTNNLQDIDFTTFLSNSDEENCPIIYWELNSFIGVSYTGTIYSLDTQGSNKIIKANTTTPGTYGVYLKAKTKGDVVGYKQLWITICGDETISIRKDFPKYLEFEFWQNSGYHQGWDYPASKYLDYVESSNPRCPIKTELSQLEYEDLFERNAPIYSYPNATVRLDPVTGQLIFNTTNLTNEIFLITLKTGSSPPFYLPVKLLIKNTSEFIWNAPPAFQKRDGYTIYYTVNLSEPVGFFDFKWNLTDQYDDHNYLIWLNFSSSQFGKVSYLYDNDTQIPSLFEDRSTHEMWYQHNDTSLNLRIYQTPQKMITYARHEHVISVKLSDDKNQTVYKYMRLNITMGEIDIFLKQKVKTIPTVYKNVPLGQIESITVFGEVNMTLNSSNHKARNIDYKKIQKDALQVYIEPQYNWNEWYNLNFSNVNCTWKIVDVTNEKLSIKVDFNDPTTVSPFIKYDKLVVFIPDLSKLFQNKQMEGRRLNESKVIEQFTAKKYIQKQGYDTKIARQSINSLYGMRWFLSLLFTISLGISLYLRGPLERLITMLFDLQIMVNFALLSITLPGNYIVLASIMKQLADLNILRTYVGKHQSWLISKTLSEEDLSYLGQRHTFGYQTFNFFENIQTFGFLILFHCFKIMIVLILSVLRRFNKNKFKFVQKQVRDRTFFDDLLKIMLLGFIGIGTSSMLALSTPFTNDSYGFINFSVSIIIILELFIALPLTYSLILGQKMNIYAQKSFQQRWSTFIFGIKILDHNSWQKQLYVIAFLITRYLFLIISFVKTHQEGLIDVMLIMWLLLFNCAMFFSKSPLYGKWNNFLGRFNTFSLLACTYHLLLFSDLVAKDVQYYGGWSLITVVVIFITVNLLFFTIDMLQAINMLLVFIFGKTLCQLLQPVIDMFKWIWKGLKIIFFMLFGCLVPYYHQLIRFFKWGWQSIKRYFKEMIQWIKQQLMSLWAICFKKKPKPIIVRPPSPPPPVQVPPPPKEYEFRLVRGIWKRLERAINDPENAQKVIQFERVPKVIEKVEEVTKPEIHIKEVSESSESAEIEIPTPKPKPKEKPLKQLVLVKGVWKRLAKRINQELDFREIQSKNIHAVPPKFDKVLVFELKRQNQIKEPKTLVKAKNLWSSLFDNDLSGIEQYEAQNARYFDPALYFRDEKNQNKKLLKKETIENGEIKEDFIEKNGSISDD